MFVWAGTCSCCIRLLYIKLNAVGCVRPKDSKITSAFDGLVIISQLGCISLCVRVCWTQRLLGKHLRKKSWKLIRL